MQKRKLGNSDLTITLVGVGAWAMGGPGWTFAWGPQDDRDSIAAIHRALEGGINWIDTAAVYGLGHSEEVVARALEGIESKPYIFTKCERVWNERREIGHSLKRDSIRRECEASLRRLKVDRIDLYQIHWPEPAGDIEEGWSTLQELKAEGKIRWAGVSNFSAEQIKAIERIAPVTSLQPPYNLLSRRIERAELPYCLERGIGVLAYSPMKSGLLAGKMTRERAAALPEGDFRRGVPAFQEPGLSSALEVVERLRAIGRRHDASPGEVAIAWVLRNPAVTAAIVGMRTAAQAKEVLGAAELQLSDAEIAAITQ